MTTGVHSPKFNALSTLATRMSEADAKATASCLDVLQTAAAMRQALHERFFRDAMGEGRFTVLALLLDAPDYCLAPSQLASASGVTRATMTGLLDGLERDSFVERRADKNDRRKLNVRLTPAGRNRLLELAPGLFDVLSEIGDALADGRRTALGASLLKLREAAG